MQTLEQNGNKLILYGSGRVAYNGVYIDTGKPTLGFVMQCITAGVFIGLAYGFLIFS